MDRIEDYIKLRTNGLRDLEAIAIEKRFEWKEVIDLLRGYRLIYDLMNYDAENKGQFEYYKNRWEFQYARTLQDIKDKKHQH